MFAFACACAFASASACVFVFAFAFAFVFSLSSYLAFSLSLYLSLSMSLSLDGRLSLSLEQYLAVSVGLALSILSISDLWLWCFGNYLRSMFIQSFPVQVGTIRSVDLRLWSPATSFRISTAECLPGGSYFPAAGATKLS
uniref:Uncharacterized protein n=1 Tax=Opuntia streptacantha TaxID=393608 RepID=A0A7C8Z7U7_OPUST